MTRRLCILLAVLALPTGCTVGPDYKRPDAPMTATYKEGPLDEKSRAFGWRGARPCSGVARGPWWEVYGDPQLNALMAQVNLNNQNILAYEAQFRAATASVRLSTSAFFPTLGAGASTAHSRGSRNNTLGQASSSNGEHGSYSLPLQATYLVDLWGAVRRDVESGTASAQAVYADLESLRLSIHSQLAQYYFALRGVDAQRAVLEETVASYQTYLELTKTRQEGGIASKSDVAEAETQLDTTKVRLIDLGIERAQYEHAIAVLIGRPPAAFSIRRGPSRPSLPVIPTGLPSDLLERRPDIAAAERRVAAANADIGVAMAAYYPSLTLSANGGPESFKLEKLFDWNSFAWSVGATLAQTLFDGGAREAQRDIAKAQYQNTVALYRQTVLTAFQQIEDYLSQIRILREEAAAQDKAVASSQRSLDVATEQYKAGIQGYLQVIIAQSVVLNNKLNAVAIRTRRFNATVLLIQGLGGGWDTRGLPTPAEVKAKPSKEGVEEAATASDKALYRQSGSRLPLKGGGGGRSVEMIAVPVKSSAVKEVKASPANVAAATKPAKKDASVKAVPSPAATSTPPKSASSSSSASSISTASTSSAVAGPPAP
ncbi:MAG: efflux transporter outer membrane subunit [Candidatus Methylacidiphilales bacterium]